MFGGENWGMTPAVLEKAKLAASRQKTKKSIKKKPHKKREPQKQQETPLVKELRLIFEALLTEQASFNFSEPVPPVCHFFAPQIA